MKFKYDDEYGILSNLQVQFDDELSEDDPCKWHMITISSMDIKRFIAEVEKLNAEVNEEVTLEEVLLVSKDGEIKVGAPFLAGAKVVATVVAQGKGKKVVNFKYKPKKASARKIGHRQLFTQIEIKSIEA